MTQLAYSIFTAHQRMPENDIALQIIRMRDDSKRGGQHLGFRQTHNLTVSTVDLDESTRVRFDLRNSCSCLFEDGPIAQFSFPDCLLSSLVVGDVLA